MITRPLDLASKLRREPRSFDWLFFVNGALIVFFFSLFGSKFVLAPAVGVDFRVIEVPGATQDARPATHHVNVTNSGQIFVRTGFLTLTQLDEWLRQEAQTVKDPVLLVFADDQVPTELSFKIAGMARNAGFTPRFAATEPARGRAVEPNTSDER